VEEVAASITMTPKFRNNEIRKISEGDVITYWYEYDLMRSLGIPTGKNRPNIVLSHNASATLTCLCIQCVERRKLGLEELHRQNKECKDTISQRVPKKIMKSMFGQSEGGNWIPELSSNPKFW
jgi:hypothetical protein